MFLQLRLLKGSTGEGGPVEEEEREEEEEKEEDQHPLCPVTGYRKHLGFSYVEKCLISCVCSEKPVQGIRSLEAKNKGDARR